MRIIGRKRFSTEQLKAAKAINNPGGWDTRGRTRQYPPYTLYYNPECGLVILEEGLVTDSDGEGSRAAYFFDSPKAAFEWCNCEYGIDFTKIIGDIDESDETAMLFVDALVEAGIWK